MKEKTENRLMVIPFVVLTIWMISLIMNINNPIVKIISTIIFAIFIVVFYMCAYIGWQIKY